MISRNAHVYSEHRGWVLIFSGLGINWTEKTAEMSHGEILVESELWQKLNRALMTCSQGQQWFTTEPDFSFF